MIRTPIRLSLSLVGLLCLLAASAAHAQFNGPASLGTTEINRPVTFTTDPAILYPATRDVILEYGDVIQIRLFSDPEYAPTGRIDADGNMLLPLIGLVHLAGLSITQAQQMIAEKLVAAQMYRDPQVSLILTDGPNALATVIGELHGPVPIVGSKRLLDVLAAAGGLPATASHVITIDRPGVGNIYIFGSFKTSLGTVPLSSYTPLTLTEATALSGGLAFDGRFKDLRIIRTVGNHRTVAVYDIKKVLNGKVPDPILQPNDIVYLPPVPFKTLLSSGALGTVLGITSLAISIAR
jgi:polysaccharide export outer membrane protein